MLALAWGAQALTIDVTPGGLSDRYADICNTEDSDLAIRGSADVRDLCMFKYLSNSVKSLDLSGLKIVGYTYPSGSYMGRISFENDEIPPYILTGAKVDEIILPLTTRIIGESAFVASEIKTIEFPTSLESVGNYAFADCDMLRTARFKNAVKLGIGVFKDCDKLSDVAIEYDIIDIPAFTFDGCKSFVGKIPASVKTVGDFAYRGTAIEDIDLSNMVIIGNYAFANMPYLNSVTHKEDRVGRIGKGAFFNDGALELIPSFVADTAPSTFAHTSAHLSAYISTAKVGAGAYANNTLNDTVVLNENVKYIGSHAFRNNTSLGLINAEALKDNIPDVEPDAFSGLETEEGRYNINLHVDEPYIEDWKNHEVWGLFNVGHYTVGIDDTVADIAAPEIKIFKKGNSILVESTHDIDFVGVYSVDGMTLYESKPSATSFEIRDIPASGVMVVKASSAGTSRIVKLK